MKIYALRITLLFFTAALFGCGTSPVQLADSKPIPEERIYEGYSKYRDKKESSSRIIIVRDSGGLGSAGSGLIYANGEKIARIRVRESLVLHMDKGESIIGIAPGTSWEAEGVELIEQSIYIDNKKDYYFRVSIDPYKGLVLQRTSQIK